MRQFLEKAALNNFSAVSKNLQAVEGKHVVEFKLFTAIGKIQVEFIEETTPLEVKDLDALDWVKVIQLDNNFTKHYKAFEHSTFSYYSFQFEMTDSPHWYMIFCIEKTAETCLRVDWGLESALTLGKSEGIWTIEYRELTKEKIKLTKLKCGFRVFEILTDMFNQDVCLCCKKRISSYELIPFSEEKNNCLTARRALLKTLKEKKCERSSKGICLPFWRSKSQTVHSSRSDSPDFRGKSHKVLPVSLDSPANKI
jgi:hypothetical protein